MKPRDLDRQKLEALGCLAGGVAHDLNNILTGILGHISYLRMTLSSEAACDESVAAIEDGTRKAAEVTKQIVEFVRQGESTPRAVDLGQLVASAKIILQAALPKRISLQGTVELGQYFTLGEQGQLSQLVVNLLINARDAMPDGGQIRISLENIEFSEPSSWGVTEGLNGPYCKLSVQDEGEGIAEGAFKTDISTVFLQRKQARALGLVWLLFTLWCKVTPERFE